VTTEPSYQLRLDLRHITSAAPQITQNIAESNNANPDKIVSYTLQCDYANLKNIQQELQKAVDSFSGVHSQRITRYIS
jgi:hypothetical protein